MAAGTTVFVFQVELADVDRGVYQSLDLRLARHPSETDAFMVTRLLAYCLEHREGIAFTEGVSAGDEPAVLARDLTGQLAAWIEVGAPAPERVHRAAKAAARVAIYTHKDPEQLLELYAAHQRKGERIHRAAEVPLYSFGAGFIEGLAAGLPRRAALAVSRTEGQLYLDLDGTTHSTTIEERRLG